MHRIRVASSVHVRLVGLVGVVGLLGVGSVAACAPPASYVSSREAESGSEDGGAASSGRSPAGGGAAGGDAGAAAGASVKAKRPLLVSGGGKVLAAPKLQIIRFQGDPLADVAESFLNAIGASAWWAATTKEYGVNGATVLPSVTLDPLQQKTIDDKDLQSFLTTHLGAADGVLAAPDENTVYVFIAPQGVKVTEAGNASCDAFGGYHSEVAVGGGPSIPYVVLPRCGTFLGLSSVSELTFTLGHEVVEAAINPRPSTAPAFHLGADSLPWRLAAGGGDEATDLCAASQNAITPPELGFTVSRSWSNAAVAAGKFPCVPADGVADIFAEPEEPDTTKFQGATFPAVKIASGQSRTIKVRLSGSGSDPFTIGATDVTSTVFKMSPDLQVSFADGQPTATGRPGDTIDVTITALARTTTQADPPPSELALLAISKDQSVVTFRPLVVGR